MKNRSGVFFNVTVTNRTRRTVNFRDAVTYDRYGKPVFDDASGPNENYSGRSAIYYFRARRFILALNLVNSAGHQNPTPVYVKKKKDNYHPERRSRNVRWTIPG